MEYKERIITQGKLEGKLEVAQNLTNSGFSKEQVARFVGLSLEEINTNIDP